MVQSLKDRAHHIQTATWSVYDTTQQWRRRQQISHNENFGSLEQDEEIHCKTTNKAHEQSVSGMAYPRSHKWAEERMQHKQQWIAFMPRRVTDLKNEHRQPHLHTYLGLHKLEQTMTFVPKLKFLQPQIFHHTLGQPSYLKVTNFCQFAVLIMYLTIYIYLLNNMKCWNTILHYKLFFFHEDVKLLMV